MPPRASTLDSIRSNRLRPTRGQAHTFFFSVLEYLPVAPENSVGSLETTSTPTPISNLFIYTPSSGRLMSAPEQFESGLPCSSIILPTRKYDSTRRTPLVPGYKALPIGLWLTYKSHGLNTPAADVKPNFRGAWSADCLL